MKRCFLLFQMISATSSVFEWLDLAAAAVYMLAHPLLQRRQLQQLGRYDQQQDALSPLGFEENWAFHDDLWRVAAFTCLVRLTGSVFAARLIQGYLATGCKATALTLCSFVVSVGFAASSRLLWILGYMESFFLVILVLFGPVTYATRASCLASVPRLLNREWARSTLRGLATGTIFLPMFGISQALLLSLRLVWGVYSVHPTQWALMIVALQLVWQQLLPSFDLPAYAEGLAILAIKILVKVQENLHAGLVWLSTNPYAQQFGKLWWQWALASIFGGGVNLTAISTGSEFIGPCVNPGFALMYPAMSPLNQSMATTQDSTALVLYNASESFDLYKDKFYLDTEVAGESMIWATYAFFCLFLGACWSWLVK